MKNFRQFLESQALSRSVTDLASLLVEMGVDPWEFFLERHQGEVAMETAILDIANKRDNLREGIGQWASQLGQRAAQGLQNMGGSLNQMSGGQAASADPDFQKAQQGAIEAARTLDSTIKSVQQYIGLYGQHGLYQGEMQNPQVVQYVQQLQGLMQYLQQQRQQVAVNGAQVSQPSSNNSQSQADQILDNMPDLQGFTKDVVRALRQAMASGKKQVDVQADIANEIRHKLRPQLKNSQQPLEVARAIVASIVQGMQHHIDRPWNPSNKQQTQSQPAAQPQQKTLFPT